jgi:type IV pilus assembly protein PilM
LARGYIVFSPMFRFSFGYSRPLLGIDISDASVEVVALEQKDGFGLRAYARAELAPGIVVRGVVQEPKKLAEILLALRQQLEKDGVRTMDVVFGLPEEYTYTRRVTMPKKAGTTWRTLAATAVAESVPYKLAEVAWDALLLPMGEDSWTVLCFAAPLTIIAAYESALVSAGFRPQLAASNALAIEQAFFPGGAPPTLVLDIGTTTTILSLFDQRGVYASSVVAVGGQTLTEAIAAQRDLSLADAEGKKRDAGFLPDAEQGAVFFLLQKTIQPLVQEADVFMTEYAEHTGATVKQLVLTGGTALLPGIADYLGAVLDLTVVSDAGGVGRVRPQFAAPLATVWKRTASLYTIAIGLALYGLLPSEKHFSLLGSHAPTGAAEEIPQARVTQRAIASIASAVRRLPLQRTVFLLLGFCGVVGIALVFLWQKGFVSSVFRADSAPTSKERLVTFPVVVAVAATSSIPDALVGTFFETEAVGEQAISLSDVHVGKSTGTIRIQNTSAEARSVPAATLIATASGTRFLIRDARTIAPRSISKPLFVQAEIAGEEGDVPPQTFTFVDSTAVPQTGLRLASSVAFHGGAPRGTAAEVAINEAMDGLLETLFQKAGAELTQKKDGHLFFPAEALERNILTSSSPALGTLLQRDATVRARVRVRTVGLTEEQLRTALIENAPTLLGLPNTEASSSFFFSGWELGAARVLAANRTAIIPVTVRFALVP